MLFKQLRWIFKPNLMNEQLSALEKNLLEQSF
jgi:hypothetical protein